MAKESKKSTFSRDLTPLLKHYMKERQRRKFIEKLLLGAGLSFATTIIIGVWATDGQLIDTSVRAIQSVGNPDREHVTIRSLNCRRPENKKLPYCQNALSSTEATWNSVVRNKDGKGKPFKTSKRFY